MTNKRSIDLRYPIGKFDRSVIGERRDNIRIIAELPEMLKKAISGLDDDQLETHYRPDGWTLRQTVHHIADSHMNSLCRFKLALTEEAPTIRPYFEDRWALHADMKLAVDVSIKILEGVHFRWETLLRSMSEYDFARELVHPESGLWTLNDFLGMYAWHCRHHTAHITTTREINGWQ